MTVANIQQHFAQFQEAYQFCGTRVKGSLQLRGTAFGKSCDALVSNVDSRLVEGEGECNHIEPQERFQKNSALLSSRPACMVQHHHNWMGNSCDEEIREDQEDRF